MAKITDIALVGGVGVVLYMLYKSGQGLFQAGESVAGALKGAPSAISQTFNPMDYGGDLWTAQNQLWALQAELAAQERERERERRERREEEADVTRAAAEYTRDPSQENRNRYLEQYRESYARQLAHIKPGWQAIPNTTFKTAEDYLEATLTSKGLSKPEIAYITGEKDRPPSPSGSSPSPTTAASVQDDPASDRAERDLKNSDPGTSWGSERVSSDEFEERKQMLQAENKWNMGSREYAEMRGWI